MRSVDTQADLREASTWLLRCHSSGTLSAPNKEDPSGMLEPARSWELANRETVTIRLNRRPCVSSSQADTPLLGLGSTVNGPDSGLVAGASFGSWSSAASRSLPAACDFTDRPRIRTKLHRESARAYVSREARRSRHIYDYVE